MREIMPCSVKTAVKKTGFRLFAGALSLILASGSLAGCADKEKNESSSGWSGQTSTVVSASSSASVSSQTNVDLSNADSSSPSHESTDSQTSESSATLQSADSIRLPIEQRIQETAWYCAPACLQMVLSAKGIDVSQDQLAQDLKTSQTTGTEYEDLAREASRYLFGSVVQSDQDPGYRALLFDRNSQTQEMRDQFEERALQDLKSGDYVFVSINNNPAYQTGVDAVHQVVIYGVDLDEIGKPMTWYFIDPSWLVQDEQMEGRKSATADELWHWMCDNPEPGYVW